MARAVVPRVEQQRLLDAVLSRISEANGALAPGIVFDLDGTLIDNRPRTIAILRELAERWRTLRPTLCQTLLGLRPEALDYLVETSLGAVGVEDPEVVAEVLAFWNDRFFYDHHIRHDTALPGSVQFVRDCHEAGATVSYFTGRDLPNMALGTLASLRDLGYPIGVPGTELVLKPNFEMSDADFKRQLTPELGRRGLLLAAFDNEPGNCNIFKELFPSCDVFLLDTQHHPSAPALMGGVSIISDFERGA